jgi:pyruvate ferredoxin oxidoreductase gamma subunit
VYRIRFHGRGGQGVKTAGRVLGTAFFHEGFEVQDAPRYGAERRGAPIFAAVRAARAPIHERGEIRRPDCVVVADESLVHVPAAGVLAGLDAHAVLLVRSVRAPEAWRERLRLAGPVLALPLAADESAEVRTLGAACAAAAARLVGVVSRASLERAIRDELGELGDAVVARNLERGLAAFEAFTAHAGCVRPRDEVPVDQLAPPDWIDFPFEPASVSAPDVFGAATSVEVRTGLWRTMRPVIDHDLCHRCSWICGTFCPDGAIHPDPDGSPRIDYDHCKGCLVCVAVCPPHAIRALPEREAADAPGATP